jgi:hypothetical protein
MHFQYLLPLNAISDDPEWNDVVNVQGIIAGVAFHHVDMLHL